MRNLLILSLVAVASTANARINEHQKENFFEYLHSMNEGKDFLSTVANHIMDQVNPMLRFTHAVKTGAQTPIQDASSWLEC